MPAGKVARTPNILFMMVDQKRTNFTRGKLPSRSPFAILLNKTLRNCNMSQTKSRLFENALGEPGTCLFKHLHKMLYL